MGKYDPYIEWNAFQILRTKLPELVEPNNLDHINRQLAELLNPSEIDSNLSRNILQAWKAIQHDRALVDALEQILHLENVSKGLRLEGIPSPGTPIAIGPLFCCPEDTCDISMFQLFDGQMLTCPRHGNDLVPCKKQTNKRRP